MDIKHRDIYSGSFVLLFAVILFTASFRIQELMTEVKIGADFLPKITAVILAILGVTLIFQGKKDLKMKKNLDTQKTQNVLDDKKENKDYATIITLFLLIGYVALMEILGFIITTTVYLFLQFFVLTSRTQRKPLKLAIIAILISVLVFYLFTVVFKIMIPSGILV